jgi:RHS repeat-associated protein
MEDENIGKVSVVFAVTILFLASLSDAQSMGAASVNSNEEVRLDQSLDKLGHFSLNDGIPSSEEYYGSTPTPEYQPLEIHASDDSRFDHMAHSPYYKVFFKDTKTRMTIGEAWIEVELIDQKLGELQTAESTIDLSSLTISNVFESVDLEFELESSLLNEALILKELKDVDRIILSVSWGGMKPEFEENGSILFTNEDGKDILRILPPFMKDAKGNVCSDVHYELIETETGYELHKVIDDIGLKWLQEAAYPVIIDPSMQTLEDAWKSSGLTPFGQYFENLEEYVNPVNGHLTITQTDLVVPGRGLDLVISRVYEVPAIFYGENPYGGDYEAPPTNVGKGWQLDFPYVGNKYLHLWGGTQYKIEWVGDTFENHKGGHFILVKNGDSTFTLTTANGTVYEFSTAGKLTQIKDMDQNTIAFTYTSGDLTSIADTIGRSVTLTYSNDRLSKITYNGAELEYSYDGNGCLVWMEDFLNRRTSYYYNSGYNNWLLSKIVYITSGYTIYAYNRFSDSNYYKYYVTDQRVYETAQVRHSVFSYAGSFEQITSSSGTVKNESDVTKGSYHFTMDSDSLIIQQVVKNASGTPIRKSTYAYNASKEVVEQGIYYDGVNLSYTDYYSYDNWGNPIYFKNAEGHEQFLSFANTSTSGFFMDNTGTIIRQFTNAFSNSAVPSSVHTALLGTAEKQDGTYVREAYLAYDEEAHPTELDSLFGDYTTYETFSGTFNENTGSTSFPVDLTGYTIAGNAVLQITGLASDPTYSETHSYMPDYQCPGKKATWSCVGWIASYFKVNWTYLCGQYPDIDSYQGLASIGPFTHKPGSLGYQSYSTNPACSQQEYTFYVTTNWKAYPAQAQYDVNGSNWKLVSSNLANTTAQVAVTGLTNGENTLYFSESSAQNTKFSWALYVPVDNSPETYTSSWTYDTYGNPISVTGPDSNTVTIIYSPEYSYAYRTEMSATVGGDTITHRATYDYYRGWMTSRENPDGTEYRFTYDLLGRIIKKEYPLLSGQSERSYEEMIYDDVNRSVTLIDTSRHYAIGRIDKLGRSIAMEIYTGIYGSGTLYASASYTYRYDDKVVIATDIDNQTHTYSHDFLGRCIQKVFPDQTAVYYSYDDTNGKVIFTNPNGFDKVYWYDWLSRLIKVEEEYALDLYSVTNYQYNEVGRLTSLTDAENSTTSYIYASLFGLTKQILPDSTYEEYEYNNLGALVSFTDRGGNQTTSAYDAIGRPTQITYHDQSTVSLSYDRNSNLAEIVDNSPNQGDYIEYQYDAWNRVISETRHISAQTYTVAAEFDIASQLTKLIYPDGMQILYSYDDLGRVEEIKRYVDGVNDEILMNSPQYNTKGLLTQFTYGNGLVADFSYDTRDRLLTLDLVSGEIQFLDLDYTYDSNSNITQIVNGWRDTQSSWHSQTESYTYDGLNRLISASCTSWSHTYSYDKVGNRTAKDDVTYTVNAMGELISLSDGTTFTYNSIGSRTGKTQGTDSWVYAYDAVNQLIGVEKNGEMLEEYVYDGNGRRIQVTADSETTTYVYFGRAVMHEENATGIATYIYGPGGRFAERTTINGESYTFYYHPDHLGSTRLVTDENANIVASVTYHPFGETDTQDGSEDHLFAGKEKDTTDLYYFGARYYDAEVGRFLTVDPAPGNGTSSQSMNRYAYCMNNPVSYVDLWGERVDIPDDVRDAYYEYRHGRRRYRRSHKQRPQFYWPGQVDPEKFCTRLLLGPGVEVHWGGEVYVLESAIFISGNIGVALAKRRGPPIGEYAAYFGPGQLSEPLYFYEDGLLIFFFDENGNCIDIIFVSFKDIPKRLGDPLGKAMVDAINAILEHCGSLEPFSNCLWALKGWCQLKMGNVEGALEAFGIAGLSADAISYLVEFAGYVAFPLGLIDALNNYYYKHWLNWYMALDATLCWIVFGEW